jgi:RNA polymerase sigma-70 factor (ECF subfamily)
MVSTTVMSAMDPTDNDLLGRWRGGDTASGETLFERHYDTLARFFRNKVSNAVPDLVQETFTRCVESRLQIKEDFRLYVFGIAYHVLIEHFRKHKRDGHPLDVDDSSMQDLDPKPGPCTLAAKQREDRMLLEALRSIPVRDQVILELYFWEDLTADDIARVLSIPFGTARGRLKRARNQLGEVMRRLSESPQDLKSTVARLEDWARECLKHLDGCAAPK